MNMDEIRCIICYKKRILPLINSLNKICIYCDNDFEPPIKRFWF